jgi:hypothetical protein
MVLVEIGPEGWTPTQQPLNSLSSFAHYHEGYYYYSCKEGRCRNLITRNKDEDMLSKPKTERTVVAFGTLFSLQCVRFITRGSLFIVGPWV